jgi:N-acetylmuramoyl-L-alanine amidase/Domain of unknown function (DUF4214)
LRRLIAGSVAFLAFTGTILVLPVYAAPGPTAEPVETSAEVVPLGSVEAPAPEAEVQEGTTEAVAGVAEELPVLTVREIGVAEFSLVGVTWAYDAAVTDTVVQVRVQEVDGGWSGWTEVGTEDAGQASDANAPAPLRGGTAPLWTGPGTGVEVEVVTRSGAQPTDVKLDLIDPGESEADAALQVPDIRDTAHAAETMPPVYSRAQWGADESLATWRPEYASTIKAAVVHHTAGGNDYTAADVPGILRAIYRYHAHPDHLGWGDIGYNVLVDKYGRIWEGRKGGLASTVIGAHAGGVNTYTFGVSMIGNYDTVPTTQSMVDAVAKIIAWKFALYDVDPKGTTSLVAGGGGTSRYSAGTRVTVPTIFAHRDTNRTACPGRYGYAKLPEIREKAMDVSASEAFVKALYEDMMGRAADGRGLSGWTNALLFNGWNRRQVAAGFSNSIEYRRLLITQAYQQVLGRAPDPRGMESWLAGLARGAVTLDDLRPTFMTSSEFYLRGGSSDAAFVDNVYRAALGRGAAAAEVSHWAVVRRTKGAAAVIRGVWGAPEAARLRVGQGYDFYLGRTAVTAEREHWMPLVLRFGDEQLREELVISQEYWLRAGRRFP